MRANVLSIWSPDVDVAAYRPQDPSDDGFLLTIYAGPSDGPGHESFDLTVCTPSWLARRVREVGRPLVGRHYLIVESMDIEVVLAFLRKQVESIEAPTWSEVAAKVGRLGHWEFEDYRP
jgi:hypothetical protein